MKTKPDSQQIIIELKHRAIALLDRWVAPQHIQIYLESLGLDSGVARLLMEQAYLDFVPSRPFMTPEEIDLFKSALLSCSKGYFEFGSGGSTNFAIQHGLTVHGVESDKVWVEKVKRNHTKEKCRVQWVDIGAVKEAGYPQDMTEKEKFPSYSRSILGFQQEFDLFLIDGRFRVACTLNTLKKIKQQKTKDVKLCIHDFWNRPNYHIVLLFLDLVAKANTSGLFTVREKIDWALVDQLLIQYEFEAV